MSQSTPKIPKISVVMAVYNSTRYLQESVESVLNQTLNDFEFIIIDDGSTDASWEMLRDYATQDSRIKLVRNERNLGLTKSLNRGLQLTQGEYIARHDADDVALSERFAHQVTFLRSHPEVVCLGTGQEWIDEEGDVLIQWQPTPNNEALQRLLLSGHNHICHPSAMMRRDTVLKVGGYDETLRSAQDLDLWLKLGEIGQLANLPDILLRYRVHSNSVSEKKVKQQAENAQEACRRAWKRRGIAGCYEVSDSWRHSFILRCGWHLFNNGRRRKAIAHGVRAIKAIPHNLEGWRLLTCALIKPLPEGQP
ncbi:MAG: glycosyltransferase [Cyanobacteria bacterium CRU_2_1]|nr:glycosyltransferase [Cyanobacteria bacterium RU_5_0]NJR60186.1 glycosyltransferase [Cyanobacteria bacterium CRU_2_1]